MSEETKESAVNHLHGHGLKEGLTGVICVPCGAQLGPYKNNRIAMEFAKNHCSKNHNTGAFEMGWTYVPEAGSILGITKLLPRDAHP